MPAGRPDKKGTGVSKLEQAFANGCTVSEACIFADISRETYYTWVNNDSKLLDRFNQLKDSLKLHARNNLAESIKSGDVDNSKWYLERKAKNEFSTRTETEKKDVTVFGSEEDEQILNEFRESIQSDITE